MTCNTFYILSFMWEHPLQETEGTSPLRNGKCKNRIEGYNPLQGSTSPKVACPLVRVCPPKFVCPPARICRPPARVCPPPPEVCVPLCKGLPPKVCLPLQVYVCPLSPMFSAPLQGSAPPKLSAPCRGLVILVFFCPPPHMSLPLQCSHICSS